MAVGPLECCIQRFCVNDLFSLVPSFFLNLGFHFPVFLLTIVAPFKYGYECWDFDLAVLDFVLCFPFCEGSGSAIWGWESFWGWTAFSEWV